MGKLASHYSQGNNRDEAARLSNLLGRRKMQQGLNHKEFFAQTFSFSDGSPLYMDNSNGEVFYSHKELEKPIKMHFRRQQGYVDVMI
jgi:hypothetical protein